MSSQQQQSISFDLSEVMSTLGRVYKNSIQRVHCDLKALSSHAAFVLTSYSSKNVIVWIGSTCQTDDRVLAEALAFEIVRDDCLSGFEIKMLDEEGADPSRDGLTLMLTAFQSNFAEYLQSASQRKRPISNSPVEFFVRVTSSDVSKIELKTVATAEVNSEDGSVPMLSFVSEVDPKKTILVLVVGNQYDVWLAEYIPTKEIMQVKEFLTLLLIGPAPTERRRIESILFGRSIRFQRQYFETALFKTHFYPESTSKFMGTASGSESFTVAKTSVSEGRCSDCVGATIFRLLGMGESSSTVTVVEKGGAGVGGDGSGRGTSFTGNPLSDHACKMKLEKIAAKTQFKFMHPPRQNKKLLVLDLDHTLMDFSCRFEFMVEKLKRPYMDLFLAHCYKTYDLAIWSQTNIAWLQLKLNGLGMLSHADYKICFTLDKSSMFTLNGNYVKPLTLIWMKGGGRWGEFNTVHIDDLDRNFELNKQSGILISPFYLKDEAQQGTGGYADDGGRKFAGNSNTGVMSTAAANDMELSLLARYLDRISKVSDFTKLDHSGWRNEAMRLPPVF